MLTHPGPVGDAALPLMDTPVGDAPLAWRDGRALGRRGFVTEICRLADRLPERRHVINSCSDRYNFMVAFAAAAVRGQITLLPHDQTRHTLGHLRETYDGLYRLSDMDPPWPDIEGLHVAAGESPDRTMETVPAIAGDRVVARVFTGGTTGLPKPNDKTWSALSDGAWRIAAAVDPDATSEPAIVATVPPQHMYGLELSILLPLCGRFAMHTGRPFYPADVEAAVGQLPPPVILVTTPIHLNALVQRGAALPGLGRIVSATADLAASLAQRAEDVLQAPVMEIYGCSEAGSLAWRNTLSPSPWRTLEGLTIDERDGEWFAEVPYLPHPVLLQDVLELHSPHEFTLRGRRAEMVVIAGKRASLAGLNAILNQVPGVVDGAYHAVAAPDAAPDTEKVTRLMAFVVAPGADVTEIRRRLRAQIDPAFMPRPLYRVDALPRSGTGKLTRAALSALAKRVQGGA